jgi:site-specific DNA-methyltransferase (adenine-specific)
MDKFLNKIIHGDAFEVLKEIPDCVIDSVICDPPYALSFMGNEWDSFGTDFKKYQEWTRQWAVEALRVAKPGATLLCFGGTRTWHRLACGLEDAGWAIKDTLMWLYGQGFPKATDISKQIDKKAGKEREIIGEMISPDGKPYSQRQPKAWTPQFSDYKIYNAPPPKITKPATPEANLWNGWKSHGLKPAWEPIIMAMKPNEGSYSDNALRWGVAGLNIDGGRIKTAPDSVSKGRFPANVILECICDEIIEGKEKKEPYSYKGKSYKVEGFIKNNQPQAPSNYNDAKSGRIHTNPECPCYILDKQSGINASRFFYIAKTSKSERNMGGVVNNHPTVKPLKLMEYLCILTKTPTGGIVLDPFAGSGTTCMAAKKTGRNYIGIELEEEHAKIAEARVGSIQKPLF